jgi:hypothetical protein
MTGLLLLVVIGVWFAITNEISKIIAAKLPDRWWRKLIRLFILTVLLLLPLLDEIVGGQQFRALCEANSTIQIDRAKAKGKTVYLLDLPDIQIKSIWVPVRIQEWRYVDAMTGEPVVSYNVLHATGGWLIRALHISEGNAPLTFKEYCAPDGRVDQIKLFKQLGVTQINRPAKISEIK